MARNETPCQRRDSLFGHHADCAVRVLDPATLEEGRTYESALVFRLPDAVSRYVDWLRAENPRIAPVDHQLVPHVTMVYLGTMEGRAVQALHRHVAPHLEGHSVLVSITGFGLFDLGPDKRTWHLAVAPVEPLAAIKAQLQQTCSEIRWQPLRSYYPGGFVPHITIWDKFDGSVPAVDAVTIPRGAFLLSELVHVGRPVGDRADV